LQYFYKDIDLQQVREYLKRYAFVGVQFYKIAS